MGDLSATLRDDDDLRFVILTGAHDPHPFRRVGSEGATAGEDQCMGLSGRGSRKIVDDVRVKG